MKKKRRRPGLEVRSAAYRPGPAPAPPAPHADAGAHNGDLALAAGRVRRGGSWKKQRVAVLVPAASTIPARVYLSHCCLQFPPNQPVHRVLCQGLEVGDAYSGAVESLLAHPELRGWEYVLTMEHDNCPPPDGLLRLIERLEQNPHLDCVGGLYWTKGPGGVAQIWGDPSDPVPNFRPQVPRPGELVECCGTGMGFNLFRLSLFKDDRLRRPWFRTLSGREGLSTQDLYFWSDARKYGHRCAVDCSVLVGHYDAAADMMW